ncbi:hypothetical protein RIF29_14307 [Crotalaria pallida]|uniref:Aminotransferase-like plant mobile domain-containing protein n=1 Tax=Crotalaria pallida TaxID=3830 RepID=A0AAN9FJU0_CROPI
MAWIHEHFPGLGLVMADLSYNENMPHIKRWVSFPGREDLHGRYGQALDAIRPENVIWMPYLQHNRSFDDVCLFRGYITCDHTKELYLSDSVLRLFGYKQCVPTPPRAIAEIPLSPEEMDEAFNE